MLVASWANGKMGPILLLPTREPHGFKKQSVATPTSNSTPISPLRPPPHRKYIQRLLTTVDLSEDDSCSETAYLESGIDTSYPLANPLANPLDIAAKGHKYWQSKGNGPPVLATAIEEMGNSERGRIILLLFRPGIKEGELWTEPCSAMTADIETPDSNDFASLA